METNKKEVGMILVISLVIIIGIVVFLLLTNNKTYTIVFNTNGGNEIASIKVKKNKAIGKLPIAEKTGYEFLYWSLDNEIINENYRVTKDITLNATYKIREITNEKTYIVTFDTDGGNEIPSQEVKENEKIIYPGDPIKEGYKFQRWTLDGEAFAISTPITSDLTLKADYIQIATTTTRKVTTTTTTTKKISTTTRVLTTIKNTTTTKKVTPIFNANCTYDGELTPGVEYVNGDYTYKYKQFYDFYFEKEIVWRTFSVDGWWAVSTESLKAVKSGLNSDESGYNYQTSTKPITSKVCKTINGKPILTTRAMYIDNRAVSIDLSSFDTSNVGDMSYMFSGSSAKKLDLRYFNTSKVEDMQYMFSESAATEINLSSFDTSKVTDMGNMFSGSAATTLNLSSFNTSKVNSMRFMFENSAATSIILSSFNTSNVDDMGYMFSESAATALDLSNFDTSKVVSMEGMFKKSKVAILDLSSFDTSKVKYTGRMFYNAITTTGYARTDSDAFKFNNSSNKPNTLTFIVKP